MTKFTNDDELDLCNAKSRITCFILYMFSMELGDPPLYAEINRVSRTLDKSQLEYLGPIAQALDCITDSAEQYKEGNDEELTGFSI